MKTNLYSVFNLACIHLQSYANIPNFWPPNMTCRLWNNGLEEIVKTNYFAQNLSSY